MWHTLVRSLTSLAQSESGRSHHDRADGALAEGLALARRYRLLGLMPRLLGVRAIIAGRRHDWGAARSLFAQALAAARLVGDRRAELISLTNIGVVDLREDRPMDALERLEEAVRLAGDAEDERDVLLITPILAEAVVFGPHDIGRALALLADCVERSQAAGIRIATISALECTGLALIDRNRADDPDIAAELLGACVAEREALDYPEDQSRNSPLEAARAWLRDELGPERARAAEQRGRVSGLDAKADEVLSWPLGSALPA